MPFGRITEKTKRIAAFSCLVAFVGGGILAPAAHYVFMSVGSSYAHQVTHPVHAAPVHVMDAASSGTTSSVWLAATTNLHEWCQYSDLFASFSSDLVAAQPVIGRLVASEGLVVPPVRRVVSTVDAASLARGPPNA